MGQRITEMVIDNREGTYAEGRRVARAGETEYRRRLDFTVAKNECRGGGQRQGARRDVLGAQMIDTKRCSRCNRELELSEFGRNRAQPDGLQVWCNTCRREHRRENRDRLCEQRRQYRHEHSMQEREYDRRREMTAARKYQKYRMARLLRAVWCDDIVRPDTCSQCGVACKPHGHHPPGAQWYQVIWLCQSCHQRVHGAYQRENCSEYALGAVAVSHRGDAASDADSASDSIRGRG